MSASSNVIASELPLGSSLHERISQSGFLDCFSVASKMAPRQAAEIISDFPWWVRGLLRVRWVLTAPFGLSTDGPDAPDKVGAFPVEAETDSELIAGFNDHHLDFRISVFSKEGRVSLATWVHPHNLAGRLYLKAILPLHVLVARNALARVARLSESGT